MVDVPPPPENPFMTEHGDDNGYSNGETMDSGTPDVAAKPGRVLVVVGIVGVVVAVLLYSIFSGKEKPKAVEEKKPSPVALLEPPPLPETPILPAPEFVPPSIPEPTQLNLIKPEDDSAAKEQALMRMKSKMLLVEGQGALSSLTGEEKPAESVVSADPNSAFEARVIAENTKAERVEATQIGDLRSTIAQGRIIQATLESALNTDLPAPIRAIVSRDTYGESGRVPLIPKGSRLIGIYSTDISGAQSRVFVVWTRVIRPDGVDVQLGSPLVDQLGTAGMGGQVDTKFQSIFARSLLSSVVSIATAIGSEKLSGGSSTTTTGGTGGGTTTTGDAATTATIDAMSRLGGVSDSFIQRFLDVRPTILVDQGSPVNVFVNRDLIFPAKITAGTRIIN